MVMKFQIKKSVFEKFLKCSLSTTCQSKIKGGNDGSGGGSDDDNSDIIIQDIVDG